MKSLKKYRYNILSFIIPLVIFTTALIFKGIFTNKLFTTSDSISQYLPTYQYLYNVLHGIDTFPYTFSKGLGGTMYGAFFYGLSSPINLLIYFFDDIQLFMALSTILKISLSGLTMYIFLKQENKNSDISNLIFSLAYSLSGYSILYYLNIMWLDSVWLAPLILIGINKIIQEKKDFTYIITLLLALVSNYYTGYMLVLFSIIYFFYKLYIAYNGNHFFKENYKHIFRFILITISIGCSIMFILIPIFLESLNYPRISNPKNIINYNFFDIISGSYIGFGQINKPLNSHGLLIYCGTCLLPLLVEYFTNKSIKNKEKKASLIVILLFLIPVIIKPLSFIWHLFTYPQDFNYRYSFLVIIFFILLETKAFKNLDGSNKSTKYFFILYMIISISLMYATNNSSDYYIYLNITKILLTLFLILLNCILITKKRKKEVLILLVIDLILNTGIIFNESKFISSSIISQYENYINDELKVYDNNYRFENTIVKTKNDPINFNYNGLRVFLSSLNKKSINIIYNLYGIEMNANNFSYNNYNMISDMLLGIKYISDENLNPEYKLINEYNVMDEKIFFQKNDYALSLGYMVSPKIKELKFNSEFKYFNELLNSLDDEKKDYFIRLKTKEINDKKYIIKKDKQYAQIYIVSDTAPNNIEKKYLSGADKYGILYDQSDSDIELIFDEEQNNIEIYALNTQELLKFKERRTQMNIEKKGNNFILASIDTNENGVLMTTIPYEKGWKVYVDGKQTKYYEILNSLLAIDLNKGEHKIEFYYRTPGIKTGIIVSMVSLIILITYEIRYNKNRILKMG